MSLWRTARPRFALYVSDGLGRDRYIGYNNGGFWANNEYSITRRPHYEYSKYDNFHTLYHMAAPFKYYSDGTGRDSYVFDNGLTRNDKPLFAYKLTDFLRNNQTNRTFGKKVYLSQGEKKFNKQRRNLENRMIRRLYTQPLEKILQKKKATEEKTKDNGEVDVNLRDENANFETYNNVYEGNEVLKNDNDLDDAMMKSQKVGKYELQEERKNLHKKNKHQYLRTSYNITKRYKLDADFKNMKRKVKVSKMEIEV